MTTHFQSKRDRLAYGAASQLGPPGPGGPGLRVVVGPCSCVVMVMVVAIVRDAVVVMTVVVMMPVMVTSRL